MHTPDLFPAELAAALNDDLEVSLEHPGALSNLPHDEPDDDFYDDVDELPEELWRSWREIEAEAVCVSLYRAL